MSRTPRISIVTCSYQQVTFLEATLRSVLDQGYPELDYIVMDGGSNDGSVGIIERYADRLAYWTSARDEGQTDALAKGFDRATGEVMGWVCSDDLLLPGALEQVGSFFAAHPEVEVAFGDAVWIDEQGRPLRTKKEMGFNRFVFLFDHNYLPQASVFWRRSVYDRVGGLDRSFDLAMDGDLWERFSRVTRIVHASAYWSGLRRYPAQKTQALRPRGRQEDERLRSRSAFGPSNGAHMLLRPVARISRVATRLALGCYGTPIPEGLARALLRYEIQPAKAPA